MYAHGPCGHFASGLKEEQDQLTLLHLHKHQHPTAWIKTLHYKSVFKNLLVYEDPLKVTKIVQLELAITNMAKSFQAIITSWPEIKKTQKNWLFEQEGVLLKL